MYYLDLLPEELLIEILLYLSYEETDVLSDIFPILNTDKYWRTRIYQEFPNYKPKDIVKYPECYISRSNHYIVVPYINKVYANINLKLAYKLKILTSTDLVEKPRCRRCGSCYIISRMILSRALDEDEYIILTCTNCDYSWKI